MIGLEQHTEHEFSSDWYRPGSCMACSHPRLHPVHIGPERETYEAMIGRQMVTELRIGLVLTPAFITEVRGGA